MKVATARAVVCLSLWLSVCQVSGFHIPAKMNKTILKLLEHYKIAPTQMFNGNPVFPQIPESVNPEAKRVYMAEVLETYEKLLSQMLKQLPTPSPLATGSADHPAPDVAGSEAGGDVRKGLSDILEMVQRLKRHGYHDLENIMQGLHSQRHIKMDDALVQSKALRELQIQYGEASSLSKDQIMQRRKRRQARRLRSRQKSKTQ